LGFSKLKSNLVVAVVNRGYHNLGEFDFTSFEYKNDKQEFKWEKHKFGMRFDFDSLPEGTSSTVIKLYVSFGGNFILPDHLQPVSAFFAVQTDSHFNKSVAVSIEHCSCETNNLRFAVCSSSFPPYEFDEVVNGTFTKRCAIIERTSFSTLVVVERCFLWKLCDILLSPIRKAFEDYYCAMYTKRTAKCRWEIYLYITQYLSTRISQLEEDALRNGRTLNTYTHVKVYHRMENFELDICLDEEEKREGWHVLLSRRKLEVSKSRLDHKKLVMPVTFKMELRSDSGNASDLNHNFEFNNVKQEIQLTLTLSVEGKSYIAAI